MNEWEWIDRIRARVGPVIGDDCAILDGGLLATADAFVEGVHFRREWASWNAIGQKMAEAAISDICAMGGAPDSILATLSTNDPSAAPELLDGILSSGVPLVGGDTTSGPVTVVSLTVLGRAERPVRRSGARGGDGVYVSGALGGSLAGLRSLESGLGLLDPEHRFLHPRARRDLARAWGAKASAMIDISDGLSNELHHIAKMSNARIEIDSKSIPIFAGTDVETALASGEEFELLATSPHELGIRIGTVRQGSGVYIDGRPLGATGYTHWKS